MNPFSNFIKILAIIVASILMTGCFKDKPSIAVAKCEYEFNKNQASKYIGESSKSLIYQKGEFCSACMQSQGYKIIDSAFYKAYIMPPGFLEALIGEGSGWEKIKPINRPPEINRAIEKIKEKYIITEVARVNCSAEAWAE